MDGSGLPSLFIASSSEGLPVAHDLQEALEHDCHATVWPQAAFQAGQHVLPELVRQVKQHQFMLAVFTPDDPMRRRGTEAWAPRDNVVFELGLATGLLGAGFCQFIAPQGPHALALPSDLSGLIGLDYPASRPDGNRLAALGPASNKLRRWLRSASATTGSGRDPGTDLRTWLDRWNSEPLRTHRAILRDGITLDHAMPVVEQRSLRSVFHFLDGLADAVLLQQVDANAAQQHFGAALPAVWAAASRLLAPPNDAADWWQPLPPIARLSAQWTLGDKP